MVRPCIHKMSTPRRFFVNSVSGAEAVLEGDEFVHAVSVLRVSEGDEIVLLCDGKEYTAIVAKMEKRRLTAHITGSIENSREPKEKIYLLIGALKGDKTELVVQKATELGVSEIGVFRSEYCSAFVNENKGERLQKVAREATKQCLRTTAPVVRYFDNFRSALQSCAGYDNKLFACEFAKKSDIEVEKISGSTAIVVGSEGGFTEGEAETAKAMGFNLISLGQRILRAETAAISLCAVVSYTLGELK